MFYSFLICLRLCDKENEFSWLNLVHRRRSHFPPHFRGEGEECRSRETSAGSDSEGVPFEYDIPNRAQMPIGIENIRPHLENMDNKCWFPVSDCFREWKTNVISMARAGTGNILHIFRCPAEPGASLVTGFVGQHVISKNLCFFVFLRVPYGLLGYLRVP